MAILQTIDASDIRDFIDTVESLQRSLNHIDICIYEFSENITDAINMEDLLDLTVDLLDFLHSQEWNEIKDSLEILIKIQEGL